MSRSLSLIIAVSSLLLSALRDATADDAGDADCGGRSARCRRLAWRCPRQPAQTPTSTAPASASATAPAKARDISVEALMNAIYSGIYDEPITLTKGLYEACRL